MNEYSPDWFSNRKTLLFSFLFAIGIHAALFAFVRHFPVFGKAKVISSPHLKVHLCVRTPVRPAYDIRHLKPSCFSPQVPSPPKKVTPERPQKVITSKVMTPSHRKAILPVKKKPVASPVSKNQEPKPREMDTALAEQKMRSAVPLTYIPKAAPPAGERLDSRISHGTAVSPRRELAYPDYGKNPRLSYPPIALRRGYEGQVVLKVLVNKKGRVIKVILTKSSGHSILDRAALRAVRTWVFKPGRLNGVPVDMWVKVPVVYELK